MVASLLDDLKREFQSGHMVTRIVLVNVAIFIIINIVKIIFMMATGGIPQAYLDIRDFFLISNDPIHVLTHPWTFITTNFMHEGLGHIFWNMLLFYWFGKIVGDLLGDRKILPLYLLSGMAGCMAYILVMNLPFFGEGQIVHALGASASVMGVIIAAAVTSPHYQMNLILIGPVKLMYIAAVLFLIDVFALQRGAGGVVAHIGGALFGGFFVAQLRAGNDWSAPVNRWIEKIYNFVGRLRSDENNQQRQTGKRNEKNNAQSISHQERVDFILDKIKATGYDSLTPEEKEFLFLASKK